MSSNAPSTKTGFSVRDILDLPDPTARCGGSGTEETEEDDTEEAAAEAPSSETPQELGFNGRSLCALSGGGSAGRWSCGSGNRRFSQPPLQDEASPGGAQPGGLQLLPGRRVTIPVLVRDGMPCDRIIVQDLEAPLRPGLSLPLCAYSPLLHSAYGPEPGGLPQQQHPGVQQLAHVYQWSW
ncbi:hypothetical protein INR49_017993 [Caranx melampygus]|nr:hypothetical protein INR49_017993 [Caranx melampygus]